MNKMRFKFAKQVLQNNLLFRLNTNPCQSFSTRADVAVHEWIVDSYYEIKTKHYNKAIQSCNMALDIEPTCVTALYNKGIAFLKQNYLDTAATLFSKAIQIDPKSKHVHTALAAVYHVTKQMPFAHHHYIQALLVDPKYKRAHFGLAVLLLQQGLKEKSELHYKQATRIDYSEHYDEGFPTNLIQSRIYSQLHQHLHYYFLETVNTNPRNLLNALVDEEMMHLTVVEQEKRALLQREGQYDDEQNFRYKSGLLEILPDPNMKDAGNGEVYNEGLVNGGDIVLKGGIVCTLMYNKSRVELTSPEAGVIVNVPRDETSVAYDDV